MPARTGAPPGSPASAANDYWHIDNESSKFGSYCFKFGNIGNGSYSTQPEAVLISPTFAIRTNVSNATTFSFYHYLQAERTTSPLGQWDGGKIEYKIDNGNWIKITDGTPAPNLFLAGAYNYGWSINTDYWPANWTNGERFYGDVVNSINNFGLVVVNISSLKGENITFRFFFGGDNNNGYAPLEGWFIDGFNITAWSYDNNKGIVSMNRSALPFYTITQNPATSANFSCLANMHSGDSCTTTWQVNASDVRGTYEFFVIYSSINYSSQGVYLNTSRINLTIVPNSVPVVSSIQLQPDYALENGSLACNFTITDTSQLDILGANIIWYRNNTVRFSMNVSVQYNTPYIWALGSGNLTAGDTWNAVCFHMTNNHLVYKSILLIKL